MLDLKRTVIAGVASLGMFLVSATAFAGEGSIYDWNASEAPVLIENESGLVFLGADKEPWRAYHWDRAEGDHMKGLYFVDMDKDGKTDVVGGGDPTFGLHPSSNPAWSISEGCSQAIVANFAADDKLDVMCNRGSEISIYTHDRQKIWSIDLGVSIDWCRAGDINGDLKNDLECKYRGRETFVRLDSEGKLLAKESEESKISDDAVDLEEAQPVDAKKILAGEKEYDLNGDGATEESLLADGNALVIQSRSKKTAVARIELGGKAKSAIVKNIDGEGKPEIVALTDSDIIVANSKGEQIGKYSANAKRYRRHPVAEFDSVYARKFSDNEKAQKLVRGAQKDLAQCYERRVRGNLFVGIGQVIFKVTVGDDGKVENIERMHSAIRDQKVEGCAKKVIDGLDFPKAGEKKDDEENAEKATVNIVLKFTFEDRER